MTFSKPPPSASRPPHRAPASIRDNDTYTETLDSEAVKAIRVQTVAFDAKCNHKNPLHRRHAARFGHTVLGTLLGTHGAFFDRSVRKTEGKRAKATVSLTVAFFTGSHRIVSLGRSVGRLVDGRQYNYPTASKIVHDVNTLVYAAIVN